MNEVKRIFSNTRLLIGLIVILVLNMVLFYYEQTENDYGLDMSASFSSNTNFSFGSDFQVSSKDDVNAYQCYQNYKTWLSKFENTDTATAKELLTQKSEELGLMAEMTELLKNMDSEYNQLRYDELRKNHPDLLSKVENGSVDSKQIKMDSIAVKKILSQIDYIAGYGDYLQSVKTNRDNMLDFNIFNDPNSFSYRNIFKTAKDFENLEKTTLTLGLDGGVNSFMNYRMTDYFLLLILAIICLAFLEERKKGLWCVIHSTPYGRVRLAFRRVGILLSVSVLSVIVLYGSNLITGFYLYGGINGLGRSIQSIELFGKLPIAVSISKFLIQYFVLRMAAAFLIALLLWLLLSAISNVKYTIMVLAVFLGVEYSLYTFLPVQSFFNILKYFNVFTYINLSDLYTNYLNINLFGYPVGIRAISQIAIIPLGLLFGFFGVIVQCYKKPMAGHDLLGNLMYRVNSITDKLLKRLNIFGMECYKTLFIQKGIVIVLLFIYVSAGLTFISVPPVHSQEEAAARQYFSMLQGKIDDKKILEVETIQSEINNTYEEFEKAQEKYKAGEMEYAQFDVLAKENATAKIKQAALEIVKNRMNKLQTLSGQTGIKPWLLNESIYESVYGEPAEPNRQKAAIVAILMITLLIAGCNAYETQSGTIPLLRSTVNGRKKLYQNKLLMTGLMTILSWVIVYGMELYTLFKEYNISSLNAPIQSLSMLSKFPIHCNIGCFLVLLYIFRLITLYCFSCFILFISSKMRRLETAYIAATGIAVIPSLLYYFIGIAPFKYISFSLPVSAMDLLLQSQGQISILLIYMLAIILIGFFSFFKMYRKTS